MSGQLKPCPFCKKPSQITKMVNLGRWSFLHRCPIVGPISFTCTTEEGCALEWNTRPTHDALVTALKQARHALNLGLNLAYEKNSSANEGFVVCGCCRERWEIIHHEDKTAGVNVQHNPESICGIMQAKMYAIDAALKAAGKL